MSRSNFVELIAVNNSGIELGTILIMPEDVCRVVPFTQNTTNLVVDDNEHDVKHYLVRGSSTEVSEKLFSKSDDQKMSEKVEHYKARMCAAAERNHELIRDNSRLMEENYKYAELFKQTSQTEGELREELKRYKTLHSGQRTNIERMQTEAQALEKKVNDAESRIVQKGLTILELESKLKELESYKVRFSTLEQQYTERTNKYEALVQEKYHLESKGKALEHQVDNFRKEQDRLRTALVDSRKEYNDLKECLRIGDRNNSAYWKSMYDVLLDQSKSISDEVRSLREQVKDLSQSNVGLRKQLAEASDIDTEIRKRLQARIKELEKGFNTIYSERESLQVKLDKYKQENTKLHEVLTGIKAGILTV